MEDKEFDRLYQENLARLRPKRRVLSRAATLVIRAMGGDFDEPAAEAPATPKAKAAPAPKATKKPAEAPAAEA